jgi:hypothetical protein
MQDRNERAARHRATARELRQLAGRVAAPETRAELLDLAERFERLAEHLSDEESSVDGPFSFPAGLGVSSITR